MGEKQTIYDIAEILKSGGFRTTSEPFEMALQGNRVIVLASTAASADTYQRSCYLKLGNSKIDFKATKWQFRFKNSGGRLEIYIPREFDPGNFHGLDREKTFYSLCR